MKQFLAGRVVVITGGSSGIGRAAALAFAAEGARVALGARRAEECQKTVHLIEAQDGEACYVATRQNMRDRVQYFTEVEFDQQEMWSVRVRVTGSDTAVLVNRGWVYSPDGASVDQARWREGDVRRFTGYVELFHGDTVVTSAANPRTVRHVSRAEVTAKIPYPVAPFYLVAVGDTADLAHPARRDLPVLDDGPHRGYALQWFSFAVIALGGAGIVVRRERDESSRSQRPAV